MAMKVTFEEAWNKAAKNAEERMKTDESLKALVKQYEKQSKRLQRAQIKIQMRQGEIFREELKKTLAIVKPDAKP